MASFGVFLQVIGLSLMPLAIYVGSTAQHGMLAEMYLLVVGAGVFFVGHLLRKRAGASAVGPRPRDSTASRTPLGRVWRSCGRSARGTRRAR